VFGVGAGGVVAVAVGGGVPKGVGDRVDVGSAVAVAVPVGPAVEVGSGVRGCCVVSGPGVEARRALGSRAPSADLPSTADCPKRVTPTLVGSASGVRARSAAEMGTPQPASRRGASKSSRESERGLDFIGLGNSAPPEVTAPIYWRSL
jgi:hypothetical protein